MAYKGTILQEINQSSEKVKWMNWFNIKGEKLKKDEWVLFSSFLSAKALGGCVISARYPKYHHLSL